MQLLGFLLPLRFRAGIDKIAGNMALVAGSVFACLTAVEIFLWAVSPGEASGRPTAWLSRFLIGEAQAETISVKTPSLGDADALIDPATLELARRRAAASAMPAEWELRETKISGAYRAAYWQGALQIYNSHWMRMTGRPPPKDPASFRILVLGDSLTYGDGIAEQYTYPRQLEHLLRRQWRVDVINAGVDGSQSEDIVRIAKTMLPQTMPDLVVYGVCLNDFLPSGVGQYDGSIKLPTAIRQRTRIGPVAEQMISAAMIRLGLSRDFFDDVLHGIAEYREGFGRDVAALNRLVREHGLPPVVAMVVDQFPTEGGRGQPIARIAEAALDAAGMTVIGTEEYYHRFGHGAGMSVSPWEGHPNEQADAIWALMLEQAVAKDPRLHDFERHTAGYSPQGLPSARLR
jgi:lysophospholipase L1-like esterase